MVNDILDLKCIRIKEQAEQEIQQAKQETRQAKQEIQQNNIDIIKLLKEMGSSDHIIFEIAKKKGISSEKLKAIMETE